MGKPLGSDRENEKTTFVTLKGVENCRELVDTLTQGAVEALSAFPDPSFLCWLAESLVGTQELRNGALSMNVKNVTDVLTGNLILNLSILAWAVAQALKVLTVLITKHRWDWRRHPLQR